MRIETCEIIEAENALLPKDSHFPPDAINIIKCWENKEIVACPGSGKTTVLLAKLKLLSARMPLENGKGICVLSHTNVAVNEIKQKLSKEASTIIGYPNYIGTIDGFINRFIVLPYLRNFTSLPIHFVDNETFGHIVYRIIVKKKDNRLKGLINSRYKFYGMQSPIEFIEKLSICNNMLYIRVNGKNIQLAGKDAESTKEYHQIELDLFRREGLLRYQETYKCFTKALEFSGTLLKQLLLCRFKYIFIDEYQDCSELQRNSIDTLFYKTESMLQKIGDLDQAIYNGINDDEKPWQIEQNSMPLCCAIRYGKEIADVLTYLRTGKETITASTGERKIKPTIIVFEDDQKQQVISKFIEVIRHNDLVKPDGIYKAIGMCENVSGLKISDYWCEYRHNAKTSSNMDYPSYIAEICRELKNGNMYIVERHVREIICKVYRYCGKRNPKSKLNPPAYFSVRTIVQELAGTKCISYRQTILDLISLPAYEYARVETIIRGILVTLVGETELKKLPKTIMFNHKIDITTGEHCNVYTSDGVNVEFDNIWGIKGETHDATLYLETQRRKGSDIDRVISLLEGKTMMNNSEVYEKSRRCVYVGFSRPKYLLCVAVQKKTFDKHKKAFENWQVIPLT